jgi:hypothetical protein
MKYLSTLFCDSFVCVPFVIRVLICTVYVIATLLLTQHVINKI